MVKDHLPRYTLRVNQATLDKLEYIAQYNGRSKNKEIEQMIKQKIKEFEDVHGEILADEKNETTGVEREEVLL